MRRTLSSILTVVLCAVLLLGAVCVGSWRSWARKRDAAVDFLNTDVQLTELAQTRLMDGANLAVVAARHLPAGDAELTALQDAVRGLYDEHTARELLAQEQTVTAAAAAIIRRLGQLPSVQESSRDQAYLTGLSASLSGESRAQAVLTAFCDDFNSRMSASLTGRLALLLGVKPLGE